MKAKKIEISTSRILLRPLREEDQTGFWSLHQDPDFIKYIGAPGNQTASRQCLREEMESFKSEEIGLFAILKENDFAGICGFICSDLEDGSDPEILWALLKQYRGQGIAIEAAKATIQWVFQEVGRRRILAKVAADNDASLNMIQHLRMKYLSDRSQLISQETVKIYELTCDAWQDELRA